MRSWYISHRQTAKAQASNAHLKNEFTEDEKYHNLMT